MFLFLAEAVANIERGEADYSDETGGECHYEPTRPLCAEDHQLESASGTFRRYVLLSSILPKQTLRHDGRAKFGWSHWLHQSYYTPPIPTSKENPYTDGLLGRHALCILGRTLRVSTGSFPKGSSGGVKKKPYQSF